MHPYAIFKKICIPIHFFKFSSILISTCVVTCRDNKVLGIFSFKCLMYTYFSKILSTLLNDHFLEIIFDVASC